MSASDTTQVFDQPGFEYAQCPWGDSIFGTKEQLQAIGIAVGMAFPGEPWAPKRHIKTIDPRGFPTKVTPFDFDAGTYHASISFPGRDRPNGEGWTDYAPGVMKNSHGWWFDEYRGSAEALVVAGLVGTGQFPGAPGMRKVWVTILPDGTLSTGTSNTKDPGAKTIARASKNTFIVTVTKELKRRLEKIENHINAENEGPRYSLADLILHMQNPDKSMKSSVLTGGHTMEEWNKTFSSIEDAL